ncbi:MAG: ArgE/DapE family deacylase [Opitutaceae bacterium]|nr:ArgE/DapE family deacylase [Opitutaceae bacterium]
MKDLLKKLISIPSVNPSMGGTGEAELSSYLFDRLSALGVEVVRQEVFPGRENIAARIGSSKEPAILLEAHMDTVAVDPWAEGSPFSPEEEGGRIYGRGSCDTKASMAVFLSCFEYFVSNSEQLKRPLVFAATVDEEEKQTGAYKLMDLNWPFYGAIAGEPTLCGMINQHKGCVRFAIEVSGKAAHSSSPELGENAISRMGEIIRRMDEYRDSLQTAAVSEMGGPTVSIGIIKGGAGVNIVPDHCRIEVDRRTVPGESGDGIVASITERLSDLPWAKVVPGLLRPSMATSVDEPFCEELANAIKVHGAFRGFESARYMTSAVAYSAKKIPSLVFGPGDISKAHMNDEFVEFSELEKAKAILLTLLAKK